MGQSGLSFTQGAPVYAAQGGVTGQYMYGYVQTYSGTQLVVGVQSVVGSGTKSNWVIIEAGIQGAQGGQGGQGTQGATSDARLKRNIRGYQNGVQTVLGIKPCVFNYNGLYNTPTDGRDVIGIIADQLQAIIPEAIFAVKGKLSPEDTEETDILHYDLAPLVMAIINAIREHTVTIDDLQTRVKNLESNKTI
jgi:hypothetical protein